MSIDTAFGPVEFNVVAFRRDAPSPELLHTLASQIQSGTVRLLDFVVVSRSVDDVFEVREVEADEFGLGGLELYAPGLATDEDVEILAQLIPPGASAAIVAFELLWAKELAAQLAKDGSVVVATERIPAFIVNEAVALAESRATLGT